MFKFWTFANWWNLQINSSILFLHLLVFSWLLSLSLIFFSTSFISLFYFLNHFSVFLISSLPPPLFVLTTFFSSFYSSLHWRFFTFSEAYLPNAYKSRGTIFRFKFSNFVERCRKGRGGGDISLGQTSFHSWIYRK